jgi:hypothetical protein
VTPAFPLAVGQDAACSSAGACEGEIPVFARTGSLGRGDVAFSASWRRDRLQTRGFSRPIIGSIREPIAVSGLLEQPCSHGLGRHPFCDLSGSGGLPSIIGRRLRRYLSAPSPDKRLFPFHFGALWFRRGLRLRAFTTKLSCGFVAVHLDLAGY